MTADAVSIDTARSEPGQASRRIAWMLVALTAIVLLLAATAVAYFALRAFEASLAPEIQRKMETLANVIAADFGRAAALGIPVGRLRGVGDYLDGTIAEHAEVRYAAFADRGGHLSHVSALLSDPRQTDLRRRVEAWARQQAGGTEPARHSLAEVQDLSFPVAGEAGTYGRLHLGVDARFVERKLSEILADTLIALFVSLLIAFQVLLVLLALTVTRSMALLGRLLRAGESGDFRNCADSRGSDELARLLGKVNGLIRDLNRRYEGLREEAAPQPGLLTQLETRFGFGGSAGLGRLSEFSASDVRLPLFVFLFAVELSRPFFPIYVRQLYQPLPWLPWLSESLAIALPMSLWVVASVAAIPFAGRIGGRAGAKRVLLAGTLPTVVGLALTGLADDLASLIAWRCLTAVGFSLFTVAALLHVAAGAASGRRARDMGVFVGASLAASVGGTAVGGILADQLGYRETFFIAAALAGFAGLLVLRLVGTHGSAAPAARPPAADGQFWRIFLVGRFLGIVLLSAAPARFMLTGFLFFFLPLHLSELDYAQSAIGRVMISYFLVMVLVSPLVSWLADRYRCHRALLVGGGLCSGLGACLTALASEPLGILAGVAGVGLGQSLVATPQLAMIPDIFQRECARFGLDAMLAAFRVVERVGSFLGPFLAAAVLGAFGFASTAWAIGLVGLALSLLLALLFLARYPGPVP
ncbi:MAG: MFS transporter [Alphaproteobacteria bacterium]|nr:MFS transporter [Alphaproteobacteria bacterium]